MSSFQQEKREWGGGAELEGRCEPGLSKWELAPSLLCGLSQKRSHVIE